MPASKPPVGARLAIEAQRRLEVGVGDGRRYARRASVETMRLAHGFLGGGVRRAGTRRCAGGSACRRRRRGSNGPAIDTEYSAGCTPRMPVHVEVRLLRLPLGFLERERLSRERDADLVRPGRAPGAAPSGPCPPLRRRSRRPIWFRLGFTVNSCTRRAVERQLDLLRLGQPFDVLVAVARQPDLDLVGAVEREGVADHRAAARAERQPVEVILLRQVRRAGRRRGSPATAAGRRPPARLTFCAAARYRSSSVGDSSAELTLSKPWLASSFGSSAATSTSSASMSRMAFWYSARFRRRNVSVAARIGTRRRGPVERRLRDAPPARRRSPRRAAARRPAASCGRAASAPPSPRRRRRAPGCVTSSASSDRPAGLQTGVVAADAVAIQVRLLAGRLLRQQAHRGDGEKDAGAPACRPRETTSKAPSICWNHRASKARTLGARGARRKLIFEPARGARQANTGLIFFTEFP